MADSTSVNLFLKFVNFLITAQCGLNPRNSYQDSVKWFNASYDFIIVGAGTAGCVVANRLSENPNWNVLLLETGDYPSTISEIPAFSPLLVKTAEDYQYVTQKDPNVCVGYVNGVCKYTQGKVLGGSSTINGMRYVRGNARDYDNWNVEGWNWKEALKYFIKSENCTREDYKNSSLHGSNGYLTTSYFRSETKMRNIIINSALEAGNSFYEDEVPIGYYETLTTIENGRRCSSAKAFLSKIKGKRNNLYVSTKTEVKKIIFVGKRAVGVRLAHKNKEYNIYVKKEVVVSGGFINSPILLFKSGVGPTNILEELKIPPIMNLPVGENFQDHVIFPLFVRVNDSALGAGNSDGPVDILNSYCKNNEGVLSNLGIGNILGFLNTQQDSPYPDTLIFQTFFEKSSVNSILIKLISDYYGINQNITQEIIKATQDSNVLFFIFYILQPKSKGYVSLNSVQSSPLIVPNYLSEEVDVQVLLRTIPYVKRLINTPTFQTCGATFVEVNLQGCGSFDTDDYWRCYIKTLATSGLHGSGTCKMGDVKDPTAVVDSKLKVRGLEALRVVDASIFPNIPSGNTYAPTMMVAEKASDLIKEYWI